MTSGPGSSGSRTGTGAGPGGYFSGSGSGGGSFGSGISSLSASLHLPTPCSPKSRRLGSGSSASWSATACSGLAQSAIFHSVLFPSLQEFSTYAENAQSWSPPRNHESHVLDRFHRIADNWSDGERKERQQNAEDHNQIPSSSLFRNFHWIKVAGLLCCRY